MDLIKKGLKTISWEVHSLASLLSHARRKRNRRVKARETFAKNNLLRHTPNSRYPDDVSAYWLNHYGKAIDPLWHVACANITGKEDVRYVPHDIWFEEILPFFNKMSMRPAYLDKNLTDTLFADTRAPQTIVKRIHGRYYSGANAWISREAAVEAIIGGNREQIIKPSLTDNGVGVRKLEIVGRDITLDGKVTSLDALESSHGADFIVQNKIAQHPMMAEPHRSSVNTIRMVTFRWNDDISVLMSFARFGTNGKLTDNAGTGGVCCGIDSNGRLNPTAIDEHGTIYKRHPTTGYDFGRREVVPNFGKFRSEAVALHRRVFHFDIVSWDFAVGDNGEPVFLEVNFQGVSYIYQFACEKPMFGELTPNVLEHIRDSNAAKRRGIPAP